MTLQQPCKENHDFKVINIEPIRKDTDIESYGTYIHLQCKKCGYEYNGYHTLWDETEGYAACCNEDGLWHKDLRKAAECGEKWAKTVLPDE
jgi:hypothetical protein